MYDDFDDLTVYAARVKRARAVLYLDFDGVLHSEWVYQSPRRGIYIDQVKAPDRTLFEWAPHLVDALKLAPDVKVVLSTSWARHPGYGRAVKWLPAGIAERVIGATFHKRVHGRDPWMKQDFANTPRGVQVQADAKRRLPVDWCALDDDTDDWPQACLDKLIACNGELGLSDLATREKLAEHLARLQAVANAQA
jgi:hypothetical protein